MAGGITGGIIGDKAGITGGMIGRIVLIQFQLLLNLFSISLNSGSISK